MKRLHTDVELDAISDLYRRIAGVTCAVEFTRPVETVDLDTVQAMLVDAIPTRATSQVTLLPNGNVLIEVREGGRRVYAGEMITASPDRR